MHNEKKDKDVVIQYFETKSIQAHPYTEKINGKNPDFSLYKNNNFFGYCELKSIESYDFIGYRSDPTFNKIQSKIHEASKQFSDSNPDHKTPNILTFLNHQVNKISFNDLYYVLTGRFLQKTGKSEFLDDRYLKRLRKRNDLDHIDYIIWINVNENKAFYMFNPDSKYSSDLTNNICKKMYETIHLWDKD